MTKPYNSAARNAMSEMERQCYDWGWEDAEQAIIQLIEEAKVVNTDQKFFLIKAIKGEQK